MKYDKKIIKKMEYRVSNWPGGKTSEMFIYPEGSSYKNKDFYWRISSATVELEESDFTRLEGVKRFIATLGGDLRLTHDYKDFIDLKPFDIYEFDGSISTHSYGKVRDFNLMIANGGEGKLSSIMLEGERIIDLSNKMSKKEFNIFYSPQNHINIEIEGEKFSLEKEDLLVIDINVKCDLSIRLSSEVDTNILQCKLNKK